MTLGKLEPIWGKPVLLLCPLSTVVREGTLQHPFGPAEFVGLCRDLIGLVKVCQTADSHKDCCIIETATITESWSKQKKANVRGKYHVYNSFALLHENWANHSVLKGVDSWPLVLYSDQMLFV